MSIGQRIIVAIVFATTILILLYILGQIFGTDEAKGQHVDNNPFMACQLLQGGIQDKKAMLAALQIMLLVHLSKTADNVVAFPGMEDQQAKLFEAGLRRAIKVDGEVRKIIERVYTEQGK